MATKGKKQSIEHIKRRIESRMKTFKKLGGFTMPPSWRKNLSIAKIGHIVSDETRRKISEGNTGKIRSQSTKDKLSAYSREKSWNWKGEDAGYEAKHGWIRRRIGKPDTCEFCSKSGLKGKQIHWANKTGLYKRDMSDWIRLCASCHAIYDRKNVGKTPWNKELKLKVVEYI